ncbi:MAG: nucleotidyltransferase domain-containing protein [Nitrospirota bacterium]
MNKEQLNDLESIFNDYPEIKLVYFFGSKAAGKAGPMSDYDFAVFMDEKEKKKNFDIKFALIDKISRFFKTDKVDIVILNLTESPELKYNIIKEGRLIYEKEPFRLIVEPKILNEYFDFRYLLLKYHLTKA